MRGKECLLGSAPNPFGITPAYAGKRAAASFHPGTTQDHPRVCGEKYHSRAWKDAVSGSPPRVRGKVPQPGVEGCRLGITPACAGKRRTGPAVRDRSWDHPRVCGEKRPDWKNEVELVGSPPRVRGKDAIQRHPSCGFGITPACAGKRRTDSKTTLSHEDHPRVCGEKTPFSENSFTKSGSPPRVRGKGVVCIIRGRAGGITPACAGKSVRILQLLRVDKDHPRVCGEKKWLWLS